MNENKSEIESENQLEIESENKPEIETKNQLQTESENNPKTEDENIQNNIIKEASFIQTPRDTKLNVEESVKINLTNSPNDIPTNIKENLSPEFLNAWDNKNSNCTFNFLYDTYNESLRKQK